MTTLLSLPTELFELILHAAITARGLKRGLRLRLVNKTFAQAITQVIYSFRILDHRTFTLDHHITDKAYAFRNTPLHSYLAHRVILEPPNGKPILNSISRLARDVIDRGNVEDPALSTFEACVYKICAHLGGDTLCETRPKRFNDILQSNSSVSEDDYVVQLFMAALLTNSLSLVEYCVSVHRRLFTSLEDRQCSFGLFDHHGWKTFAGHYCSPRVLEFLMTYGESTVNQSFRSNFLTVVAQSGRADIFRFVYNFKRQEVPWNFDWCNIRVVNMLQSCVRTHSLDILKLAEAWQRLYLDPTLYEVDISPAMKISARAGRLDTMAYLLEQGVDARGISGWEDPQGTGPVCLATGFGHPDAVELLVEHGANPAVALSTAAQYGQTEIAQRLLEAGTAPTGRSLINAASKGYMDIVRLLLDAGAEPNEESGSTNPLAGAIAKEHTAMFKLLIERGADLHSNGVARICLNQARRDGLESMLLLLEEHGVKIRD